MPDKTDYARKCQQLDVLIDLLERENKRLQEETGKNKITTCVDCKAYLHSADWCITHNMEVNPSDFCSWAERWADA